MYAATGILTAVVVMACTPSTSWAEKPLDEELRLFLEYFEGEFNNHNQVNFETDDSLDEQVPEEARHPWHHHTIRRVDAPAFGEYVFFAQINEEGPDGPVVRQRVHVVERHCQSGTIRQRFYAIEAGQEGVDYPADPTAVAELPRESLRGYPEGCQIVWWRRADRFSGDIAKGYCAVVSRRSGTPLYIAARMELSRDEIWHLEEGFNEDLEPIFGAPGNVPFKLRRVSYYACRVEFLGDPDSDGQRVVHDVRIHDQGGVAEFAAPTPERGPVSVQLSETIFPAGTRPDALQLSVHEKGAGEELASERTTPGADRIGIDVGWVRAECSAER